MTDQTAEQDSAAELVRLQRQVEQLEAQLLELEAWAGEAVATAQAKVYWLDRWGLDLNAFMARPIAGRVRAGLRRLRRVYRLTVAIRRRLAR